MLRLWRLFVAAKCLQEINLPIGLAGGRCEEFAEQGFHFRILLPAGVAGGGLHLFQPLGSLGELRPDCGGLEVAGADVLKLCCFRHLARNCSLVMEILSLRHGSDPFASVPTPKLD